MKVKLSQIINAVNVTKEEPKSQLAKLQEKGFPIKISYRIKRLADKLQPVLDSYNSKREELIKEFGEEYEVEKDGKTEKVFGVKDPEKLKLFVAKFNELVEIEEEIDFEPISISLVENVEVSAKDLPDFIFVE